MHGGDIYRNDIELDFSVNVNPLGVSENVKKAITEAVNKNENYPDIQCQTLKRKLSEHFGTEESRILVGNGASEIIMAVCHYIKPGKVLLFAPGFSGYRSALEAVGADLIYVYDVEKFPEEIEKLRPDIVFLTNPNNPTGQLTEKSLLEKIYSACGKAGSLMLVDECFIELTGKSREYSLSASLRDRGMDRLIILRAFTKSFAIPGVRLGYALCGDEGLAAGIGRNMAEWNVSVLAQKAGIAAMEEDKYLKDSASYIRQEREFLIGELEKLGFKVSVSSANYILFYSKKELYRLLLEQKILIRDCSDYVGLKQGYYRIAVRKHEENVRLIDCMAAIVSQQA